MPRQVGKGLVQLMIIIGDLDVQIGKSGIGQGQHQTRWCNRIVFADDQGGGHGQRLLGRPIIAVVEGWGEKNEAYNPFGVLDGEKGGHQAAET